MRKIIHKKKITKKVAKNCSFCKEEREPDFSQIPLLEKYLSERGKILSRAKTGICAKHQKRLAKEIKRARFLGLLPFVTSLK